MRTKAAKSQHHESFSVVPVFFLAGLDAAAQTNTNAGATRAMSLQDCIQEALQHNLDVQIQRYNPQISLYNLNAAYGGYDPTFNLSGQHNIQRSAGGEFHKRPAHSRHTTQRGQLSASSFSGTLPWGLQL